MQNLAQTLEVIGEKLCEAARDENTYAAYTVLYDDTGEKYTVRTVSVKAAAELLSALEKCRILSKNLECGENGQAGGETKLIFGAAEDWCL